MIDTTVPLSPGWWMSLLAKELAAKQPRLKILDDYLMGRPPLVLGTPNQQAVFYRFQQVARSNFAALIAEARRDRLAVRAIRTAVDGDENGDDVAWRLHQANNLAISMSTLTRYVVSMGGGYLATALDSDEQPRISAEDPRQMITYDDPVTGETRAAFKLFHDFLLDMDFAVLWLPGERHVAFKPRKVAVPPQRFAQGPPPPVRTAFNASAYEMLPFRQDLTDDQQAASPVWSEMYDFQKVPVEWVPNQDGIGDYELHTDLLDRINHTILQRVVITTMQAFKQRAIEIDVTKEKMPEFDDDGNKIDYNDIFSADPGALWELPPGAKIWESMEVNLQGVLSSIKDDVLHLAAVTKTPMSMFTPDAATQTAEGAQLQREGLVFSVETLQRLIGRGLAGAFSTAFEMIGDKPRADLGGLSVEWLPAERYSLAERASADSQATGLTWEQKQRIIWQQTPTEIAQASAQRAQDAMQGLLAAGPQRQAPLQITAGGNG